MKIFGIRGHSKLHHFLLEAISKIGFCLKVKAGPSFNRPENITGSPTGILKYVEDLKRGPNTEIIRGESSLAIV